MAKDLYSVRNAFKFGVQTMLDGQVQSTWEGVEAMALLRSAEWPPATKWEDHIPVIAPKPKMFLSPGIDNPQFVAQYEAWKADLAARKAEYLAAMRNEYKTVRLVLMAYNTKLGWFVVPDNKSDGQWLGFVNRTILWTDKGKIMRTMVGLK